MFTRPGIGVVGVSESVGSPCVGEVKALATFAYPHDEARRTEAAFNLSDAVDDVVEFWHDLARIGGLWHCGDVRRPVNGLHVSVSESTNQ